MIEPCAGLFSSSRSRWISDHYRPNPQCECYTPARSRNLNVTLPPAPAMCMSTPARTRKTLRIYASTIIEMHWFRVFSHPAGENMSFYRLLIKRFMDNWETSPNVRLALLCLCAVKTFFELPFHIIYWNPVARLHPDPAVFFFSRPLPTAAKFIPPAPARFELGPAGPNAGLYFVKLLWDAKCFF